MLPREGPGWELGILEGETQQEQGSCDGHPQLCQARSAMPGDTSMMRDGGLHPPWLPPRSVLGWTQGPPQGDPGSPRGQLMPGRGTEN